MLRIVKLLAIALAVFSFWLKALQLPLSDGIHLLVLLVRTAI